MGRPLFAAVASRADEPPVVRELVTPLAERLPRQGTPPSASWIGPRGVAPVRAIFMPPPANGSGAPEDDPLVRARIEQARQAAEHEGLQLAQAKVESILARYLDGIERLAERAREPALP